MNYRFSILIRYSRQVLHVSEVKELKIKLEEGEEKMRTIDAIITSLRNELEDSRKNNGRLEKELTYARRDLNATKTELDIVSQSESNQPGIKELANIFRNMASIKKEYQELKHQCTQEIKNTKLDISEKTREITGACLEVYTSSQFIIDRDGKQVLAGSLQEVWEKLQISKLEKTVQEERADQFEVERDNAIKDIQDLEAQLNDLQMTLQKDVKEETDDINNKYNSSARIGGLEAENSFLRSSLQDIASMVVTDSSQDISSSIRPRPVLPKQVKYLTPRRSRSLEPRIVETTVTGVQAAFNKRQTQLYQLHTELASIKAELGQESTRRKELEEKYKDSTSKFGSVKIDLMNSERERDIANKLSVTLQQKLDKIEMDIKESKEHILLKNDELETMKGKAVIDAMAKESVEKQLMECKTKRVTERQELNEKLKNVAELKLEIQRLEADKFNLLEEVRELQERFVAVEKDQERMEREKIEREKIISLDKNNMTFEVNNLRNSEQIFKDTITDYESMMQKLKSEININESSIMSLKNEINEYERTLKEKELDISKLNSDLLESSENNKKINNLLSDLRREKNELLNQYTGVNLKNDALEEEVKHLRVEYQELKNQIEVVNNECAVFSQVKEQLTVRLLQKEKEVKELEVKVKNLETYLEQEEIIADELSSQVEQMTGRNKDLLLDNSNQKEKIEKLDKMVLNLKKQIIDGDQKIARLKEDCKREFESEKKNMETNIRKIEAENYNLKKSMENEMKTLKEKLEMKYFEDIKSLNCKNQLEKEKLNEEIDYLNQQIENLRTKNAETFLIAENSRSTAEVLAKADITASGEKINHLTTTIEKLKKELSSEKEDNEEKIIAEVNKNNELQVQLSDMKQKFQDECNSHKQDKFSLEMELKGIKKEKLNIEEEKYDLITKNKIADDSIEELKTKYTNIKYEKDRINEDHQFNLSKSANLESQLIEKNRKVKELITEKQTEVEILETKIYQLESNEKILTKELEELKERCESTNIGVLSDFEPNYSRVSELTLELDLVRKTMKDNELANEKELNSITELRRKLNNSEFERRKLENFLGELQQQNDIESESKNKQLTALQSSLFDSRERERKLEDIRHILEIDLANRSQEQQDIIVKSKAVEGKVQEMEEVIAKLDQSKSFLEQKFASLNQALTQADTGNRIGTPISGRRRFRSGGLLTEDFIGVDAVVRRIFDILGKLETVNKEKEELMGRLEMLRQTNQNLSLNKERVEEEKAKLSERLASSQLQLEKLEMKVSVNDQVLAEHEESNERLKLIISEDEKKMKSVLDQLNESNKRTNELQTLENEMIDKKREHKVEISRMTTHLKDMEEYLYQLEKDKAQLEKDNYKIKLTIEEKEEQIQVYIMIMMIYIMMLFIDTFRHVKANC